MSASATVRTSSTSVYATAAFWERLWRSAGIQSLGLFIIGYVIYGNQPQVGASADALAAFYDGDRTRILIAAVFFGLSILNLLWFAAALKTTLADAGQDGWGAAATASSAAVGGLFLLIITVGAALAYSIASSGNNTLTSGLNDFVWACVVLSSFPRAMLIMSGAFGLWRAGLIVKRLAFGNGNDAQAPDAQQIPPGKRLVRLDVGKRYGLGEFRFGLTMSIAPRACKKRAKTAIIFRASNCPKRCPLPRNCLIAPERI